MPSGFHISYEFPFIGASPDAVVSCDCCETRVLEVKCPYCLETKIKTMAQLDYLSNGKLKSNHNFFYQVHAEMLCVGVRRADFLVWSSIEQPHCEEIYRDENLLKTMVNKASAYFYNIVLPELLAKYYSQMFDKSQ